jgi:nicotinamidase-related amidase
MKKLPGDAVLLIIDVQKGFDNPIWGARNNPGAESKIAALLGKWRQTKRPVFHVQHLSRSAESPLSPGQSGSEFKDAVRPVEGEPVFQKQVNSAFIGTDLEARLREKNLDTLVIAGLTTDHCVSTTARMAGNLGFSVHLIADATAAFDRTAYDGKVYQAEEIHQTALASLHGEFATVVNTSTVLEQLD